MCIVLLFLLICSLSCCLFQCDAITQPSPIKSVKKTPKNCTVLNTIYRLFFFLQNCDLGDLLFSPLLQMIRLTNAPASSAAIAPRASTMASSPARAARASSSAASATSACTAAAATRTARCRASSATAASTAACSSACRWA